MTNNKIHMTNYEMGWSCDMDLFTVSCQAQNNIPNTREIICCHYLSTINSDPITNDRPDNSQRSSLQA